MGDEDDGRSEPLLHMFHDIQDLLLDRDIQGCRRLVGNQEGRSAGKGDGDHHALAHPSGELMGILTIPLLAIAYAHLFQDIDGFLLRLFPCQVLMFHEALGNLVPDPDRRVEGCHRVLKDHADVTTAYGLHLLLGLLREILPEERDLPFLHIRGWRWQQPHDRPCRHAFPAARFPYDAKGLAFFYFKTHTAHCIEFFFL